MGKLMPMIQIEVPDPWGPQESDTTPADYLVRCGEAFWSEHGYVYTILTDQLNGSLVRTLQITIPADAAGGTRAVKITAPERVYDMSGEPMSETEFDAKYGGSV